MTWSVLVIDDNDLVRKVLGSLIEESEELVLAGAANDPTEALRIIRQMPVDAVICDIQMPDVNGLALIARLQEVQPDIVVVTYSSDDIDPAIASTFGIASTFDKAGDPVDLLQILVGHCGKRESPTVTAQRRESRS